MAVSFNNVRTRRIASMRIAYLEGWKAAIVSGNGDNPYPNSEPELQNEYRRGFSEGQQYKK